jgi:hypothetical protein
MATFSQQFLAQLGSPAGMLQGAANLGGAIGGIGGQIKEKRFQTDLAAIDTTTLAGQIEAQQKLLGRETDARVRLQLQSEIRRLRNEQRELEQFGQLATATEQGIQASQDGDVVALDDKIAELRGMLNTPGLGIDQKRSISRQINDLTGLRPAAKESNVTNETKELINLNNKINDPALLDSERVKIQARIDTIRQNPTVVENFQQFRMNRMRFQTEQENIEARQWLDENMSTINAFIEDGDDKGLDDFIKDAGEYTDDAQAFATSALKYKESRIKFKEQSENKKRAPNLDLFQQEIDLLPEELKKNLGPVLKAYEEVAKKWNAKTETWEGGVASRAAATRLETLLQQRITAAQNTASAAVFNDSRSERTLIKRQIFEAELKLEAANNVTPADTRAAWSIVTSRYANLKDKDKPSPEDRQKEVAEEVQRIVQERVEAATETLDFLNNYGKEAPVDDGDKGEPQSNEDIISEAIKDNPNRTREEIIEQLIRIGDLPATFKEEPDDLTEIKMRRSKGFVAKMENLGSRGERIERLGTREERMADLRKRMDDFREKRAE